jgi:hypothetical protein
LYNNYDGSPQLAGERPAYPLHPPALVRHFVFRLRDKDNPRWPSFDKERAKTEEALSPPPDNGQQWREFCDELEAVINFGRRCFGSEPNIRLAKGRHVPAGAQSINTTVLLPLTPEGHPFRVRLRLDVHTETYAITIAVDNFDAPSPDPLNRTMMSLMAPNPGKGETESALHTLYDTTWNDAGAPLGRLAAAIAHEGRLRGALFCDFRGIVLRSQPVAKSDDETPPWRGDYRPLDPSLAQFLELRKHDIDRFMHRHGALSPTKEAGSEGVICSMLDGKALYAAPLVTWGARLQPIKYLLVVATSEPDQVGRLARRLHVLGELRHAALFDYDAGATKDSGKGDLKAASKALRVLGGMFDNDVYGSDGGLSIARLKEFNKTLTKLNTFADGGITYRVEQSRYYAAAFKERLVDLRVGRIEGYQPYDAFVRRYIYALFGKIDQIGRRYDALSRRIDRWTFLSEADSSSNFYEAINRSTNEIKEVATKIGDLQGKAGTLLNNAEKFATVFAVYYVGSVAVEFISAGPYNVSDEVKEFAYAIWAAVMLVVVLDVAGNNAGWSKNVFRFVGFLAGLLFTPVNRGGGSIKDAWTRAFPPKTANKSAERE